MINSVNLYGKLKGRIDMANSRTGKLKLNFELAVRRPPGAPPKFEGETRLPDFVPVTVQGIAAERAVPRLKPWIVNGCGRDGLPEAPFISVSGVWTTRRGKGRIYHECLAQTLVVHEAHNGNGHRQNGDGELIE